MKYLFTLLLIVLAINIVFSITSLRHKRAKAQFKSKTYKVNLANGQKSHYTVHSAEIAHEDKARIKQIIEQTKGKMGVTEDEVIQIAESLDSEQYVLFRPVNPGIAERISAGEAVGKGMNIHAKSSDCSVIDGMVAVEQLFSKLWTREKWDSIEHSNDDNQKDIAKHADAVKEIEKKACSQSNTDMIIGKALFPPNRDLTSAEKDLLTKRLNVEQNTWANKQFTANKVEVIGYHQFKEVQGKCKSQKVLPVVADYDILILGNCKGQKDDATVGSKDFENIYKKAKQTGEDRDQAKLNDAVYKLNLKENPNIKDLPSHLNMGFAPKQSMKYIEKLIDATSDSGVVRHSAEVYNYVFTQEFTTEPHLLLYKKSNGAYLMEVLEMSRQATDRGHQGLESQRYIADYLRRMQKAFECKCIPINLLWTQFAQFDRQTWTILYTDFQKIFGPDPNENSDYSLEKCPLYKQEL